MLIRQIKSELLKGRHSIFYLFHIILPLLAIAGVRLYYGEGTFSNPDMVVNIYFTLMAAVFPIGIAWATALSIGWEEENGFQRMLTVPHRSMSLFAKLSVLYIMGTVTTLIIVFGGMLILRGSCSFEFAGPMLLIFLAVNLILYPLHLFLDIVLGKAFSILIAFGGCICSLLLLTVLGDNIWVYIPYCLTSRLAGYHMMLYFGDTQFDAVYHKEILSAVPFITIWCVILLVAVPVWFHYWQGKKASE